MENLTIILTCLSVCGAKILEISLQSLKTVSIAKGQKLRATLLAFMECLVWGFVVSSVITTLSEDILLLFFYCCGYSIGLFVGMTIESKLAIGTSNVQFIADEEHTGIITEYLTKRQKGYTVFNGHGTTETVNMILVILPRKEKRIIVPELQKLCNNNVFIVTSDVNRFIGGYGAK